MKHRHVPSALLVGYARGGLPPRRAARVAARVRGCAVCGAEAAAWQVAAEAVRADAGGAPPDALLHAALARVGSADQVAGRVVVTRGRVARHVWAVLVGQLPVLRREIWPASALMFILGAGVCLTRHAPPGAVLALLAPLVAALGVCLLFGPLVDPGLELVLAAPTSPRLVLLARLALVAGFDLGLGLATSGVLAVVGGAGGFWSMVSAWLGPMALLCALSLLLSVWITPVWGASFAFLAWGLRVLADQTGTAAVLTGRQASLISQVWGTSVPVLAAAAVVLVVATVAVPYRVRPA